VEEILTLYSGGRKKEKIPRGRGKSLGNSEGCDRGLMGTTKWGNFYAISEKGVEGGGKKRLKEMSTKEEVLPGRTFNAWRTTFLWGHEGAQ